MVDGALVCFTSIFTRLKCEERYARLVTVDCGHFQISIFPNAISTEDS